MPVYTSSQFRHKPLKPMRWERLRSEVAATSQLMFTLGFTLGTGIVLGTLKPYRQRQGGPVELEVLVVMLVRAMIVLSYDFSGFWILCEYG